MSDKERKEARESNIFQEKIDESMSRLMVDSEEPEDEMLDPLPEEDYDSIDSQEEEEISSQEETAEAIEKRPELKVELFETDQNRAQKQQTAPQEPQADDDSDSRADEMVKRSASPKSARPKKISYVPITEDELAPVVLPVRKKHKGLKVTGIVAAMLVVTAGCAYGAASYYYSDRFFEGTTINGIDCSHKTAYEVEQAIAAKVENYSIEVASRDLDPQMISGSDINYRYLSDGEVLKLLKSQKPYEWVKGFFQPVSYTTSENIAFDKKLLQAQVKALTCVQEENQVAPENAYVAFTGDEFTIVPETEGREVVVKEAYKALDSAISGSETALDLNATDKVYATAAVTSDSTELAATRDAYNNYTKASITYTFGDNQVVLDGTTLKEWLQFDDKGQLLQDEDSLHQHITDFVAQLAATYDTVGTSRAFNSTNGRTVYVYGSAYGWKIDQVAEVAQLTQEIRTGTQVVRDPVYSMTANSRGYNDLGNTYIEVDMGVQHMYYYQNGSIIFDSDFVSGSMTSDRMTPEGIYLLYNKKSPETLRGSQKPDGTYEYETPVSYWMPFNGGVGFHDAPWQPYFGGSRYLEGGSHGCINLPSDSAAVLYSIIQYNVPIVCFY